MPNYTQAHNSGKYSVAIRPAIIWGLTRTVKYIYFHRQTFIHENIVGGTPLGAVTSSSEAIFSDFNWMSSQRRWEKSPLQYKGKNWEHHCPFIIPVNTTIALQRHENFCKLWLPKLQFEGKEVR